jgi:ribosomal protein S6
MEKDTLTEEKVNKKGPKKSLKTEKESDSRVYEASYLLLPLIIEDDIQKESARVKENISLSGGSVFFEEEPSFMKLAYPMSKVIANRNTNFENAYFGWVKFECEPENISKVKKALENNENVLRFLILKTVKENVFVKKVSTFAPRITKSPAIKDEEEIVLPKEEVATEINEAELDKTIEDLVIE